MARTVGIGIQSFDKLIENNYFYIDKTGFIREWWESGDDVTLITRPRRFGKTLNMSMIEQFFSNRYAGRGDLFETLSIWKNKKYHVLQGAFPVISISFANVKEKNFEMTKYKICQLLADIYTDHIFLLKSDTLEVNEQAFFQRILMGDNEKDATLALHHLSKYLSRYYNKKVIILLDEYDTPMQEAYIHGYWEELSSFTRSLFNCTFKTNPWLDRAILTGITRVSKESIFSDLNNLKVVTTTSDEYGTSFGFTEEEVFRAMDEFALTEKDQVKCWYDGFIFGKWKDIYNPWSIINYLDTGKIRMYWANTSSNSLVGKLIREGNSDVKITMEDFIQNKSLHTVMDEQIVFNQLDDRTEAIWSLLLASGYLRVEQNVFNEKTGEYEYDLKLTNREVSLMFRQMITEWFSKYTPDYNAFIKALLAKDLDSMNEYMNRVACDTFSYFDAGNRPSARTEPERFYHGFVLGLIVELTDRYIITSNRESGFGRYDIILEPKEDNMSAYIIEFKVYNPKKDRSLEDAVKAAQNQIEEKKYASMLEKRGIPRERIEKYGFAFEGKHVLIG